jgi:predicted O-methyltransferase YrrM
MTDIERVARRLQRSGSYPLWDGYREVYARDSAVPLAGASQVRSSNEVRSEASMGCFFTWLVEQRKPDLVVEFGTAFGVSAMYWAAGLDRNERGRLLTFEPNETWHAIARQHLQSFSARVLPVAGTFEANIDTHRGGQTIDIAFVDAIHTSEFVDAQVRIVIDRLSPGGLIVLDDINFSGDMRACWKRWAKDSHVAASVALNDRVGVLEMGA